MNMPTNIFVVDDDAAVRDALALLLGIAGHAVTTYASATAFLDTCTPDLHGCLILDVDLPGMDGPALQEELLRRGIRLPVIFLSGHGTIPISVRTIKAGALNFLTKPVNGSELLASIREASIQQTLWQRRADDKLTIASRLADLTGREREIMKLAVAGFSSKEIAQHLGISHRTVEIHRTHIMQKAGVSHLLELARLVDQLEFPLPGDETKQPG